MRRSTLIIGLIAGLLMSLGLAVPASAAPAFRALVFTKTTGYRHDSIPAGISMFQQQAAANNFELVHSEDSSVFTAANLATFDVLIMLQTSGMVWTSAAQRQAVEGYLASGKGIVAVHNATDMGIEGEYPWWDQTVNAGAHMPEHSPGVLPGTAIVADKKHPSTASLPDRWNRSEEWYNFDRNPRGDVHVLVTADERTYNPGSRAMGPDHPISWCRNAGGGRVWATAHGARHRVVQRDELPQPRPRRRQVGRRQRGRRLRRHRLTALPGLAGAQCFGNPLGRLVRGQGAGVDGVGVGGDPSEGRPVGLDVLVGPLPDALTVLGIVGEFLALGDPAPQDRFLGESST